MTYVLLTVLVVQLLSHFAPDLARLRRYDWFALWLTRLRDLLAPDHWSGRYTLLLVLGVPLLAVGLAQSLLADSLYGLPALVFAVAVLFYAWGPRDLDQDVESVAAAGSDSRGECAKSGFGEELPLTAAATAGMVGRAAQRRWFGPLLWFFLLGPFGALLYRLVDLLVAELPSALSGDQTAAALRLHAILDWPVAHLMALGTAIATDFDTVSSAWRERRAQAGGWFVLDSGLVATVLAAGVRADLEEAPGVADIDLAAQGCVGCEIVLRDALAVVWRVLIVWMAILSLLALASLLA